MVFERADFPLIDCPFGRFHGTPITYVPLAQTHYQHISSTQIRAGGPEALLLLPRAIRPQYVPRRAGAQTLNHFTANLRIEGDSFVKDFANLTVLVAYRQNSKLWNRLPFRFVNLYKITNLNC